MTSCQVLEILQARTEGCRPLRQASRPAGRPPLRVMAVGLTSFQVETNSPKLEHRSVQWKRITIVGVGLLGGSLGLALKQRRLANAVIGFVRRSASLRECKRAGAVDEVTRDLEKAVNGADLIVLCTPIAQMRTLVERM